MLICRKRKSELPKRLNLEKPKNFALSHNAQLSSEQRNTKATAMRLKHKTHCKPQLPRVANLLKLFVMRFFGNAKLANENNSLNTENYKHADNFL